MTDRWRVGANLATLANALLGVGAVAYTLAGNKLWAMLLVVMAIGFDGLDGLLSRRSPQRASSFGRVADSVADATSFGLAPAVMLAVHTSNTPVWTPYATWTAVAAGAYLLAALARLTYFTLRAHGLPHFLGVPTPESALAVVLVLLFHDTPGYAGIHPVGVLAGAAIIAVMMVVPVPYPKIRKGSRLRLASAVTAGFAAVTLVVLQFRPASGTLPALAAEVAPFGLLVGVAVYYIVGPFTVPRAAAAPE